MTERARILLVDDRPENLLALEAILGSLDQELVRAGSGEEALRALLRADFALILLDAHMPGMDGYETATRIKRRMHTKDVPIIFVTAVDMDPKSSYRGYVVGGADYISKPFDPWMLRAKVQVFIDLWAARRLQTRHAALLRERVHGREDMLDALRTRFEDLDAAMSQLTSELHQPTGPQQQALELVGRRLDAFRDAFAGPDEGADAG
jgi:CheY-like chemotaxis protein